MYNITNELDVYDIYLRKSRMDIELEKLGEEKTLERHEIVLTRFAREHNLIIGKIFREVVSGESISSRPEIQKVLKRVESGVIRGVIVMELERLARGDTQDQGIIYNAFKYSNVLIVTPTKTYDLSVDFDSEYVEFNLFMSRREYKTTTRRLSAGTYAAKKEGKFVGSIAPFGWVKYKLKKEKGYTLRPHPVEYPILREAYEIMLSKKIGVIATCAELNLKGYKTRNGLQWAPESLYDIIKNPEHAGYIRINNYQQDKYVEDSIVKIRRTNKNVELVDGLHKKYAVVTIEEYEEVMSLIDSRNPKVPRDLTLKNALAGLVRCAKCNKLMQRRPYPDSPTGLMCRNPNCDNISAPYDVIEEQVIKSLKVWLENYKVDYQKNKNQMAIVIDESNLKLYNKELKKLEKRKEKICSFYEDGSYTYEMFHERISSVNTQIEKTQKQIVKEEECLANKKLLKENQEQYMPKVEKIIELFETELSAVQKNSLLKEVLEKIEYLKTEKTARGGDPTNFTLKIYPKIPKLMS